MAPAISLPTHDTQSGRGWGIMPDLYYNMLTHSEGLPHRLRAVPIVVVAICGRSWEREE
jgi:hypothetical protein